MTHYIYESPDQGQTIFRHEIGKPGTKELYKVGDDDLGIQDDQYQEWLDAYNDYDGVDCQPQYTWTTDNPCIIDDPVWQKQFEEAVTWNDIQGRAKNHPALKEAMDHMMMIYNLSKDYEDDENGV